MHFLIDAGVPRSAAAVLRQLGHEVTDVRDVGMRDAPDHITAAYARDNHLVLVSRDFDFADIRNYRLHSIGESWCSSFKRTPRRSR